MLSGEHTRPACRFRRLAEILTERTCRVPREPIRRAAGWEHARPRVLPKPIRNAFLGDQGHSGQALPIGNPGAEPFDRDAVAAVHLHPPAQREAPVAGPFVPSSRNSAPFPSFARLLAPTSVPVELIFALQRCAPFYPREFRLNRFPFHLLRFIRSSVTFSPCKAD